MPREEEAIMSDQMRGALHGVNAAWKRLVEASMGWTAFWLTIADPGKTETELHSVRRHAGCLFAALQPLNDGRGWRKTSMCYQMCLK